MQFFVCLIIILVIILFPILSQIKAHQSVDEEKFKHYKLKAFDFLFKGMQGKSVEKYGIIMPMLIVQLQGYIVGILTLCFIIICEISKIIENYLSIVAIIFIVHVITVILITQIAGQFAKKRKIIIKDNYFVYSALLFTKTIEYKDLKISYKKDKIHIYRDDKIILRIDRIIENSKYLTHKIIEVNGRKCIITYTKAKKYKV